MQPSEKSGEPSMEDILASIRKIIADDPAAPAAKGASSAVLTAPRPAPSPASGSAQPAPSHPTMSSLEQELADLLRDPVEVPPAARPAPAPFTAPPAPSPFPPQSSSPAAGPSNNAPVNGGSSNGSGVNAPAPSASSGLTAWLRGKPKAEAPPSQEPSLAIPAAPGPVSEITPFPPEAAPKHSPAISAQMAAPVQQSAGEPQSATPAHVPGPMIAPSIAKHPEVKPAEVPASMQAILERLNGPTAAAGSPTVKAQPVPAQVKSRTFSVAPAITARAPEANDVPMAPANRPIGDAPSPASAPVEKPVPAIAAMPAVAPPSVEAAPVPAEPTMKPAADAITASPVASAATPTPEEPAAPVAVSVVAAPIIAAMAAKEPSPAAAETAPAVPILDATPTVAGPTALPAPVLEDILAEAMRPMVRQWLDENMRAALEKALRAEMSESLLSVLDKMKVGEKP